MFSRVARFSPFSRFFFSLRLSPIFWCIVSTFAKVNSHCCSIPTQAVQQKRSSSSFRQQRQEGEKEKDIFMLFLLLSSSLPSSWQTKTQEDGISDSGCLRCVRPNVRFFLLFLLSMTSIPLLTFECLCFCFRSRKERRKSLSPPGTVVAPFYSEKIHRWTSPRFIFVSLTVALAIELYVLTSRPALSSS